MAHFCRRLVLALAIAQCLLGAPAGANAAQPFAVRGIALGLLLADFKIAPAPDQARWPGAVPVCSNTQPAQSLSGAAAALIALNAAETKTGLVKCAFFYPQKGELVPAGMLVAGVAPSASFVFVPDRAGALRLAVVRFETDSTNYETIRSALQKRYGPPQTVVRGYANDQTGARLPDETTRWNNGVSQIQIDERLEDEDIRRMSLEYRHDGLADEADKRLRAAGSAEDDLL